VLGKVNCRGSTLLPRSNTCSPPFLCTPLRCSKRCCPRELSQRSRSTLCLQNRRAGYSFQSLFHNRPDSHRYLGSKGWPATTTSMWLQPPPSGGGVRCIATQLLQRRPRTRFYCELLQTSRRCLRSLKRATARRKGHQYSVVIFRATRGILDLLIIRPRQPLTLSR
jgi:hypothetical protein